MEDLGQSLAKLDPKQQVRAKQVLAAIAEHNRGERSADHSLQLQKIDGSAELTVARVDSLVRLVLRGDGTGTLVPLYTGLHDDVYEWVRASAATPSIGARVAGGNPEVPRADFVFGTRTLTVIAAGIESLQILDCGTEVIVSADDNHLTHSGGVSAAIWDAAGVELDEYVQDNRPVLSLADVWPTAAGALNLKAIYHAVTVDFDTNRKLAAGSARSLYGKILDMAANSSIGKIAMPLLVHDVKGKVADRPRNDRRGGSTR